MSVVAPPSLARLAPPAVRPVRRALAVAGLAFALGTGATAQQLRPEDPAPYDVLLVVLDDVGAADLALYGGPVETPHLARLASQGVVFTNAYANPTCGVTRRAIQYGRWRLRGNGEDCTETISADTPLSTEASLAEALPRHTSVFLGKWHLGAARGGGPWQCAPIARGYEYWLAGLPTNVLGELYCVGSYGYREWLRVESSASGCSSFVSTDYHPRVVRDAFLATWPALRSPRFASVNSNLAHAPFHRPPADLLPAGYPPTRTDRERFEAMVRASDESLGPMLAQVDLARTLVIVIGDNGTPGAVAPEPQRAKTTTFERGVRVPLVIAGGPTVKPGRTVHELVHAVDLWSTIVEAGGGDPASPTSRSLLPILRSVAHPPIRTHVLCGVHWETPSGDRCAVSSDGFKLRQLDLDGDELADHEELYDLRADPGETTDLLAVRPDVAAALRAWILAESP